MLKQKITFFQWFVIGCLLTIGILFWINPSAYRIGLLGSSAGHPQVAFLQAGDYSLRVKYVDSPADNAIIVYSDQMIAADNTGGVEYVRQSIEEGSGEVTLLLHLDEGTYGLQMQTIRDGDERKYLTEVAVWGVHLENYDNYFLGGLCILGAAVVLFLGCCVPWEKYKEPLYLFLFGLGASLPLFSSYIIAGHDIEHHLVRIEGIYRGLQAGEFPVYINTVPMAGYGQLSSTMYPQLFLYPAAFLRLLNVSLMLSYKLLLVGINVGTAMLTFYAVKRICKSAKTAYLASLLYTFSLYRLADLYFRSALGETLAMTFLPLVIWGIYEVLWGDRKKWHLLMLGVTGVLQSHVLSVEMSLLFLVLEVVCWAVATKLQEIHRIWAGVKAAVGTCLLNAFFLVPFLFFCREDLQVFHMDNMVPDSTPFLSQMFAMFSRATGVETLSNNARGEMPLTIGWVVAAGVVLFCITIAGKRQKSETISFGKHCLCFGFIALLLASWIFPWEKFCHNALFLEITRPLQFAWRFLSPASILLCIVAAIGIAAFSEERPGREWIVRTAVILSLISAAYFFDSMMLEADQYEDKTALEGNETCDALYMYWNGVETTHLQFAYDRASAVIETYHGSEVSYEDLQKKGAGMTVHVAPVEWRSEEEYLLFPLYYFPGYEVWIDGERANVFSKNNLVACVLPEEPAQITVRYAGVSAFRMANLVTLLTAFGMAGYAIAKEMKKKRFLVAKHIKRS